MFKLSNTTKTTLKVVGGIAVVGGIGALAYHFMKNDDSMELASEAAKAASDALEGASDAISTASE